MEMLEPQIIKGGTFKDHRGEMRFVNDFKFDNVNRFYFIKHHDVHFVRAWQGHQFETKYFYPISGRFVVAWVKIDDFEFPSLDLAPNFYIIDSQKSEILFIPKGYANGLKAMETESEVMIFSDMELEQSVKEKTMYPADWWLDWEKIEHL